MAASGVRFYAGVPLITREGFGLGSLCVLGNEPRDVSQTEMSGLEDLAGMVMSQIELQHAFGRIDPLSGLPNRRQFLDDLDDLGRDTPGVRRLAVLVDLARSEQLNDGVRVFGSAFIDGLVHEAARRLRTSLPRNTTAYHVGATQFAFIAPPDVEDLAYAAELRPLLKDVGACASNRFAITAAIGIAPFTLGEAIASDVLRTAYSAAEDGRAANTFVGLYSAETDSAHSRRFGLLNAFATALEQPGQLRLVYRHTAWRCRLPSG